KHAAGAERARFLERSEFFFRYAIEKLSTMPTRTLARPVVLLLSYGYMHAYFQQQPDESAPPPAEVVSDFGRPEVFVPQKTPAPIVTIVGVPSCSRIGTGRSSVPCVRPPLVTGVPAASRTSRPRVTRPRWQRGPT